MPTARLPTVLHNEQVWTWRGGAHEWSLYKGDQVQGQGQGWRFPVQWDPIWTSLIFSVPFSINSKDLRKDTMSYSPVIIITVAQKLYCKDLSEIFMEICRCISIPNYNEHQDNLHSNEKWFLRSIEIVRLLSNNTFTGEVYMHFEFSHKDRRPLNKREPQLMMLSVLHPQKL